MKIAAYWNLQSYLAILTFLVSNTRLHFILLTNPGGRQESDKWTEEEVYLVPIRRLRPLMPTGDVTGLTPYSADLRLNPDWKTKGSSGTVRLECVLTDKLKNHLKYTFTQLEGDFPPSISKSTTFYTAHYIYCQDTSSIAAHPPHTHPIRYGQSNFWLYEENKEHPPPGKIYPFAIHHFTWQFENSFDYQCS